MKTKLEASLKVLTVIGLLVGILLTFWQTLLKKSQLPDEKIGGVVRVLMHDTSHYTLLIQRKNSTELEMRSISLWNVSPRFIADVPFGQPMWVLLKGEKMGGMARFKADIHIHSPKEVEGAGWDHGKSGHGIT